MIPGPNTGEIPFLLVVGTGLSTFLLASVLAYVLLFPKKSDDDNDNNGKSCSTKSNQPTNIPENKSNGLPSLYFYFATQTGTAESFCRQLEREATSKGFQAHVQDLENVQNLVTDLKSPCILITATYGEGEPTDNARIFADLCKEAAGMTHLLIDKQQQQQQQQDQQQTQEVLLKNLEYCVFGLGNKQYDHYNAMGKFFDYALKRAGATQLLPLGTGDDDADLEGDFETWKDTQLWPALIQKYGHSDNDNDNDMSSTHSKSSNPNKHDKNNISNSNNNISSSSNNNNNNNNNNAVTFKPPDSPYVVEYHQQQTTQLDLKDHEIHHSSRHYFDAVTVPVTIVRELRSPKDGGSTLHMEIDVSNTKLSLYQTADNLGILPCNTLQHVQAVAAALGYDLDCVFSVKAAPGREWQGAPFPMPITVRHLLTHYCDLTAAPRRAELKFLATFCTNLVDRQFLNRLASKDFKDEYKTKILDNYYGLVHLLLKCPSIQIPLDSFLDVCPRLQPRFFTIASSNVVHPNSIHLTVAVTQATRPADQTLFQGVCSSYLANIHNKSHQQMAEKNTGAAAVAGDGDSKSGASGANQKNTTTFPTIRAFLRPSTFRLPADVSKPIILIGPGTGIAPMRALLQEREHQRTQQKLTVGRNILYFGCKKRDLDYLYQSELEAWKSNGTLDELHLAFSREPQEHGVNGNSNGTSGTNQKVYVQHLLLLEQNAAQTRSFILEQGAHVYVCGGVKMGHDVQDALTTILAGGSINNSGSGKEEKDEATKHQAKDYLDHMARQGRFVQELWA